jgi:hypothetical protein
VALVIAGVVIVVKVVPVTLAVVMRTNGVYGCVVCNLRAAIPFGYGTEGTAVAIQFNGGFALEYTKLVPELAYSHTAIHELPFHVICETNGEAKDPETVHCIQVTPSVLYARTEEKPPATKYVPLHAKA